MPSRGGKRAGAGRKLGPHAPYRQRSVNLSVEVWRFIAAYELSVEARSESDALEQLIRSHPLFANPTRE